MSSWRYIDQSIAGIFVGRRENYHGKTWEGNQLNQIMKNKNLNKLEELLPKRLHCYVEAYRMLNIMNKTVSRNEMKDKANKIYDNIHEDQVKHEYIKECKDAIDNFLEIFNYLKFTFNQSKTNKIHTIKHHLLDYIDMTGKTLGSLDQCIEAVHQYFDQRLNSSKYKVKDKTTEVAGRKLEQLVLHFNSYNIYN